MSSLTEGLEGASLPPLLLFTTRGHSAVASTTVDRPQDFTWEGEREWSPDTGSFGALMLNFSRTLKKKVLWFINYSSLRYFVIAAGMD